MQLKVSVEGIAELRAGLQGFSDRRFNAALATGLTRTGQRIVQAEKEAMPSVFDRPNPFTLGSVSMKPATAATLTAEVFIKEGRAQSYLSPEVFGGPRKPKGYERKLASKGIIPSGGLTVPAAGAKLDQFGNLDKGQLGAILGQQDLSRSKALRLTRDRKGINAQIKAGGRYFVVRKGDKTKLKPGIYLREFVGRHIVPVLLFVRTNVYRPRLDFPGIGVRIAQQHLGPEIDRAIAASAVRLLARGG